VHLRLRARSTIWLPERSGSPAGQDFLYLGRPIYIGDGRRNPSHGIRRVFGWEDSSGKELESVRQRVGGMGSRHVRVPIRDAGFDKCRVEEAVDSPTGSAPGTDIHDPARHVVRELPEIHITFRCQIKREKQAKRFPNRSKVNASFGEIGLRQEFEDAIRGPIGGDTTDGHKSRLSTKGPSHQR
jgi:hypothetical protein